MKPTASVGPKPRDREWKSFIEITRGAQPWPGVMRAADLLGRPGDALDIGCGAGRDSRYLLEHDFHVTAVDASPWSAVEMRKLPRQRQLDFVESRIEDFALGEYDLIDAQFSLPFVPPADFFPLMKRLMVAIRPGGVVAMTLFGPHDEWNVPGTNVTFVNKQELPGLLSPLEIVYLGEEDSDGQTADGTAKHWHVFSLVGRRG